MSGLNRYNFEKVIDDLKLISKSLKSVQQKYNLSLEDDTVSLSKDLLDRLYRDVSEMRDKEQTGKTYGGHIENGEIQEEAS